MERVLRSTSLPRRVALYEIAELFLLRLLRPFDGGFTRAPANARLRVGLMFLGMRILTQPDVIKKSGSHTLSKTKLSVDRVRGTLDWGTNSVIRCYRDLNSMGVITYEKGSSFTPAAYGFPSRNKSAVRVYNLTLKDKMVLAPHRGTISALVDGLEDPIADIIRCMAHPAISYGSAFDEVQLVVAFADAAGVFPETLGISEKAARAARKRTVALREPGHSQETLPELLDRLAEDPRLGVRNEKTGDQISAREAQDRALAQYEDTRAENRDAAHAKRALNKIDANAGSYLWKLLSAYPCPKRPDTHQRRSEMDEDLDDLRDRMCVWVNDLHTAVLAEPPLRDIAALVPVKLQQEIVARKLNPIYAEAVARFVFEAPSDADLDDYLEMAEDEDDDRPKRTSQL